MLVQEIQEVEEGTGARVFQPMMIPHAAKGLAGGAHDPGICLVFQQALEGQGGKFVGKWFVAVV